MGPLYQVGDVLRVRQWEDMMEQFGPDEFEQPAVPFGFNSVMRGYCGSQFTVKDILHWDTTGAYEYIPVEYLGDWTYGEDMLEPLELDTLKPGGDVFDLFDF